MSFPTEPRCNITSAMTPASSKELAPNGTLCMAMVEPLPADDDFPPEGTPKNLANATPEELAAFGLRKTIASLANELHWAIEEGLDEETLHDIVGLWEANNSELTFDRLVADGSPSGCDECGTDVTPYDFYGQPVEGAWEWYIVADEVWRAAATPEGPARWLCIGCLEKRIGRRLTPEDFPDNIGINEPSPLNTPRLSALLPTDSSQTGS